MARGKETAVVDVIVNNEQSRKKIKELSDDLTVLKKKRREALAAGDENLAATIKKEMGSIQKELTQMQRKTVNVDDVLRNLNKVPLSQLQAAARKLRSDVQNLDRTSDEYHRTILKIEKVEREIQAARSSRRQLPSWVTGMGAAAGGIALANRLQDLARRGVEAFARFDDKVADVQKTTGMAKEEVRALDVELQKIDTRTARMELLDLAVVAGKLGITGVENVEGFVRAADQVKVALAEDLGGDVEGAIRKIGKLVEIFKLEGKLGLEKSILSVGSAINSLGADSTANEEYLVEFTNRMAGIAPGANIPIEKVLGLGSALDQIGQSAEVGATTTSQVITGMFKKTGEYARIAGMDVKEFSKLLKEDANEAFLKFLEGLSKGGDMEYRTKALASLKLEGTRSTQVLGALADKIDIVREAQALASEEFAKATSLTEEYNTKNSSAQAVLEKRRKVLDDALITLGERLMPLWSDAIGLSGNFTRALGVLLGWLVQYRSVLLSVGATIGAYIVVQKEWITWQKVQVAWQKLTAFWSAANSLAIQKEIYTMQGATTSAKLLATAKALLAGNVRAAGVAFKMFIASVGPIGWITLAVGTLGTAFSFASARVGAMSQSTKELAEINKKAGESIAEEKVRLEELLRTASNKTRSDKERRAAIEELQKAMPNGIDLINEETIANGQATAAVEAHCQSLLLLAKIQAGKDKLVEIEKKRIDLQMGGGLSGWQKFQSSVAKFIGLSSAAQLIEAKATKSNLSELAQAEVEVQKIIDGLQRNVKSTKANAAPEDNNGGGGGGDFGDKDKKKWSLEKDAAFMKEKVALRRKLNAGEIATEEEFEQQLRQLEIEALERRIALHKEKGADMERLRDDLAEKQYAKAKQEKVRTEKLLAASLEGSNTGESLRRYQKEQVEYDHRLRELGLFGKKREKMTREELAALENLERNHTKALQRIYVDRLIKDFQDGERKFTRSINQLKIANNAELNQANSFAKKKALLHKYFSREEADRVRTEREADRMLKRHYMKSEQDEVQRHLETLLADYQKIMANLDAVDDQGISLGALDPEEVERVQAVIDDLNQQLGNLRKTDPGNGVNRLEKVDILGFTAKDWEDFFTHLRDGKTGIDDWAIALGAIGNAFGVISDLMTAIEQRELKQQERTARKKKQQLDKQLQDGLISQDGYNAAVQEIDEKTEAKREEIERKQAVRQKAQAVYQALISTSLAIMSTAAQLGFPAAIPFIAAVATLGAVQIGTILATPLPGAEDGGSLLDVLRTQDGKSFRAKYDPDRRGFVDRPSVLVGESGREYVIPDEGVDNPTIRPVLDVIERARRNGTLDTIDLTAIISASIPGRAAGGRIKATDPGYDTMSSSAFVADDAAVIERLAAIIDRFEKAVARMQKEGIPANIYMTGRSGLAAALERYEKFFKDVNIGK